MPESFVNQASGRCSVPGAKLWFNCNPDSPMHWFLLRWIEKCDEKRLLHIHFLMDDNPSLSDEVRERYRTMYSGVFYRRFILGEWVMAQGAIYRDAWSDELLFGDDQLEYLLKNLHILRCSITIDYGTVMGMQVMDSQDGLETHQYTFGGLADCYQQFIMDISGAAEIPVTRLFGSSSSGLNATGESGLRITTT